MNEKAASISPDGNWLAFESDEAGLWDVWVQAFPDGDRRYRISPQGGVSPVWARDSSELFYLAQGGLAGDWAGPLMAVRIREGGPETWMTSRIVMEWPYQRAPNGPINFDSAPDGRFLALKPVAEADARRIIVVENWSNELERLVPTHGDL